MTTLFTSFTHTAAAFVITTGLLGAMGMAQANHDDDTPKHHTMKRSAAEDIALQCHPGEITFHNRTSFGSDTNSRYVFDVKGNDAKTYRVSIDAKTGQVLEDTEEK